MLLIRISDIDEIALALTALPSHHLSRQLVVASPLEILSLRPLLVVSLPRLLVALPLVVLLLRHLLGISLRQLVVALPLVVLPSHPLILLPSWLLITPAGC